MQAFKGESDKLKTDIPVIATAGSAKKALDCLVNPLNQGFLEIKEPLNSQNLAVGEFVESEYVQDRAAIDALHSVVDNDARNIVWLKDIASGIIGAHDVKQRGLGCQSFGI